VAHINKLCVAEGVRRRGIGRALVAEAAQRAHAPIRGRSSVASRPLNTMTLHVDPVREAAFGLYRSMGFRETSRRLDYYCKGRDAAFMELDMTEFQPWNATPPTRCATSPRLSSSAKEESDGIVDPRIM
jgi:ribosomal protein S18 acetylase RimI-like enzyme